MYKVLASFTQQPPYLTFPEPRHLQLYLPFAAPRTTVLTFCSLSRATYDCTAPLTTVLTFCSLCFISATAEALAFIWM